MAAGRRTVARRLTKEQLARLRRQLLDERRALEHRLAAQPLRARGTPGDAVADVADRAASDLEECISGELDEVLADALTRNDEALQRLANRTYGTCEECGRRIPYERLRVIPSASLCVGCKAQLEAEPPVAGEPPPRWHLVEQEE